MIYVLSHADSDGRFASYAAWKFFQTEVAKKQIQFYEVQYNRPFPLNVEDLTKEDQVYILDFSYKREILDPVFTKVSKLVVLDHHETGESNLDGAPYGIFDMSKSGALLAWDYFFPQRQPPLACVLVNDRDLWKWEFKEDTASFEAWLQFERVGQNWDLWDRLVEDGDFMLQALNNGELLVKHNESMIAGFVKNPENIQIRKGFLINDSKNPEAAYALYNGNYHLISELASHVYTTLDVDVTIDWRARNNIITFSVRSPNPERFSAKEYAEQYGGGGHPEAAGFGLPFEEGCVHIKKLMTNALVPKQKE